MRTDAPVMWNGSFEIGTDQRGHFIHPRPTAGGIARRLFELLAQMRLEHLAHQPVDRAADRRDLLQHRPAVGAGLERSEEHTSELQSLMRISYAVFCLKKNTHNTAQTTHI